MAAYPCLSLYLVIVDAVPRARTTETVLTSSTVQTRTPDSIFSVQQVYLSVFSDGPQIL